MAGKSKSLDSASKEKKREASEIARMLDKKYGKNIPDTSEDPLETLILTVLSQNTNDMNRDRAMAALMERFSTWENIIKADRRSVEAAIRVGGLAHQKSKRIRDILKWVRATFGKFSLDELDNMPTEEAHDMLMKLKGVGPKTAAIVLLFGFGKPVFPVDTHIHRVTNRLGLLSNGVSAEAAHEVLGKLFEEKNFYSIHINLIQHGRTTCKARKPLCSSCFLIKKCAWPEKLET